MGHPRHRLGHAAERATADWLTRHGWRVLARRHRSGSHGEMDVVCLDPSGRLVAIEVRARHSARTGAAADSLDARRVGRLFAALAAYAAAGDIRPTGLAVELVTAEPDVTTPGRWRLRRTPEVGAM